MSKHPDFDHYREVAKSRMFRLLYERYGARVHPAILVALTVLNKSEPTTKCPICDQEVQFIPELNRMTGHPITVDGQEVQCPGGRDA